MLVDPRDYLKGINTFSVKNESKTFGFVVPHMEVYSYFNYDEEDREKIEFMEKEQDNQFRIGIRKTILDIMGDDQVENIHIDELYSIREYCSTDEDGKEEVVASLTIDIEDSYGNSFSIEYNLVQYLVTVTLSKDEINRRDICNLINGMELIALINVVAIANVIHWIMKFNDNWNQTMLDKLSEALFVWNENLINSIKEFQPNLNHKREMLDILDEEHLNKRFEVVMDYINSYKDVESMNEIEPSTLLAMQCLRYTTIILEGFHIDTKEAKVPWRMFNNRRSNIDFSVVDFVNNIVGED